MLELKLSTLTAAFENFINDHRAAAVNVYSATERAAVPPPSQHKPPLLPTLPSRSRSGSGSTHLSPRAPRASPAIASRAASPQDRHPGAQDHSSRGRGRATEASADVRGAVDDHLRGELKPEVGNLDEEEDVDLEATPAQSLFTAKPAITPIKPAIARSTRSPGHEHQPQESVSRGSTSTYGTAPCASPPVGGMDAGHSVGSSPTHRRSPTDAVLTVGQAGHGGSIQAVSSRPPSPGTSGSGGGEGVARSPSSSMRESMSRVGHRDTRGSLSVQSQQIGGLVAGWVAMVDAPPLVMQQLSPLSPSITSPASSPSIRWPDDRARDLPWSAVWAAVEGGRLIGVRPDGSRTHASNISSNASVEMVEASALQADEQFQSGELEALAQATAGMTVTSEPSESKWPAVHDLNAVRLRTHALHMDFCPMSPMDAEEWTRVLNGIITSVQAFETGKAIGNGLFVLPELSRAAIGLQGEGDVREKMYIRMHPDDVVVEGLVYARTTYLHRDMEARKPRGFQMAAFETEHLKDSSWTKYVVAHCILPP